MSPGHRQGFGVQTGGAFFCRPLKNSKKDLDRGWDYRFSVKRIYVRTGAKEEKAKQEMKLEMPRCRTEGAQS